MLPQRSFNRVRARGRDDGSLVGFELPLGVEPTDFLELFRQPMIGPGQLKKDRPLTVVQMLFGQRQCFKRLFAVVSRAHKFLAHSKPTQ